MPVTFIVLAIKRNKSANFFPHLLKEMKNVTSIFAKLRQGSYVTHYLSCMPFKAD